MTTLTTISRTAQHNAVADIAAQSTRSAQDTEHLPKGTEVRGFALYVGLSEEKLASNDPKLSAIVTQIKALLAELTPKAETSATVALAPAHAGGRDIDIVRRALRDPSLKPRQNPNQDRARGGIVLDLSRSRVLIDSVPAELTFREFELLQFLVLREGRTVSREEIIQSLWADAGDEESPNERTIDVHVRRLRVKLAHYQDIVRTVRGLGYRFDRHADVSIFTGPTPSPDVF